ncbi:hypothetical protein [Zooshikella ganghwensis]|uniref:Uncharacterized protein n=1 Tax=Zooshikella ganghwensis TaxID=202772 RepID=A0A4P9VW44_9GAMM|nr:hypothetical protein [Zooshikella ganghwensis]RDH46110.1 hypothetical protein B9G39_23135 [Zooshikella ganghwensis]
MNTEHEKGTPAAPDHLGPNIYVSNVFNSGYKLKGTNFKLSNFVWEKAISSYEELLGKRVTALEGTLADKNLENFHFEFVAAREKNLYSNQKAWALEAMKKVSFGRVREELGYKNWNINITDFKNKIYIRDGKEYILREVPDLVEAQAFKDN